MGPVYVDNVSPTMDLVEAIDQLLGGSDKNNTNDDIIPLDALLRPPENYSGDSIFGFASNIVKTVPEVVALIIAYSLVILCSLLGNSLVCFVIFKNRRLHTVTNMFIANLAISDILITVLNIPFNIVRNIFEDWPFGKFMCSFVNIILMTSVYVSTFTMAAIAIDRYIVIMYPLRPRITAHIGVVVVVITWIAGIMMSLPFAIYSKVEAIDLILKTAIRCRIYYPEPADQYEQAITLFTVISQYVLPMGITAFAYGQIVRKLWTREMVGQPNANQHLSHQRARRKTIKMLILVVVIFCICWMPLNMYHLLTDFHPDSDRFHHNSSAYLACHWFAISSVCYNPFIYCWLNESFRYEIRRRFRWYNQRSPRIHVGVERNGLIIRADKVTPPKPTPSSSSGSRSDGGVRKIKMTGSRSLNDASEIDTSGSKDTSYRSRSSVETYPLNVTKTLRVMDLRKKKKKTHFAPVLDSYFGARSHWV